MPLGRMLKIVFPILYNEKSNPCYMLYLVNCCLLSRLTDILAAKIISIFKRNTIGLTQVHIQFGHTKAKQNEFFCLVLSFLT